MSHRTNTRIFSRRYGRGWWAMGRQKQFSSADKPAPSDLAFAGTTGSAEVSDSKVASDTGRPDSIGPEGTAQRDVGLAGAPHAASRQRDETAGALSKGANCATTGGDTQSQTPTDQQRPTPLPTNSAGGGVLVAVPFLVLAAFDRYATLAVIIATLVIFAWAVVRANMK
ncbi:MAG: hypothetical protein E6Q97_15000 [Desulfurellales bacterium]|nr:MAG: hypothetical protein E6Q97_15000 [Desulfurellales bacterium]